MLLFLHSCARLTLSHRSISRVLTLSSSLLKYVPLAIYSTACLSFAGCASQPQALLERPHRENSDSKAQMGHGVQGISGISGCLHEPAGAVSADQTYWVISHSVCMRGQRDPAAGQQTWFLLGILSATQALNCSQQQQIQRMQLHWDQTAGYKQASCMLCTRFNFDPRPHSYITTSADIIAVTVPCMLALQLLSCSS